MLTLTMTPPRSVLANLIAPSPSVGRKCQLTLLLPLTMTPPRCVLANLIAPSPSVGRNYEFKQL